LLQADLLAVFQLNTLSFRLFPARFCIDELHLATIPAFSGSHLLGLCMIAMGNYPIL